MSSNPPSTGVFKPTIFLVALVSSLPRLRRSDSPRSRLESHPAPIRKGGDPPVPSRVRTRRATNHHGRRQDLRMEAERQGDVRTFQRGKRRVRFQRRTRSKTTRRDYDGWSAMAQISRWLALTRYRRDARYRQDSRCQQVHEGSPLRIFANASRAQVTACATGFTMWIALVAVVLTLMVAFVVRNVSVGERHITRKLERLYSLDDPQFARSMSLLLGPPIVDGNQVQTLVNGDEIFPSMLAAIRKANEPSRSRRTSIGRVRSDRSLPEHLPIGRAPASPFTCCSTGSAA